MQAIKSIFRLIYLFYALVLFTGFMFLVLPLVLFASFWGKIRGANMIYRLCSWWADAWFFLVGIRHRNIFEAPIDKSGHFIFVANHISYLDAALIVKAIRQPLRPLGKAELSRIPVFGWIYSLAIVTVNRNSPEHRARSVRELKAILAKGVSIFLFPEGTFNTSRQPLKTFYDGAFRIAIETQTPIQPVLFLDSYDRMPYYRTLYLLPGRSRAVFLEPIAVKGLESADIDTLKNRVFEKMKARLLDYGASWIQFPANDSSEN